jgi:hypothetical protein
MQIRDWSAAQELDREAALYIQTELATREGQREKRDREFWMVMFGGEVVESDDQVPLDASEHSTLPPSDDELIARSMLARR